MIRTKLSTLAIAIDSPSDITYLNQFNFKTVLDLRSQEERELQPGRWVLADDDINYVAHDYSIMAMLAEASKAGKPFIEYTFEVLDTEYGSVEGYLKREVGLTDVDIAKLRNIYTQ